MARPGRFTFRLLLTGILFGGAYLVWVSTVGSPAVVNLLPRGATVVAEVHGAEDLAKRVSGTRFAAALSKSAARSWLERTEGVKAFDALLAAIGRITGVSPGRRSAFDVIGSEAAIGWYPAVGAAATTCWVAGGRLSVRAWIAASALRIAGRLDLSGSRITREEMSGRAVYAVATGPGQSLHFFLAGRVLLAASDRALLAAAARAALDENSSVAREPGWLANRNALPESGQLFVWVRDRHTAAGASSARSAATTSAGALVRAGETIEIDVVAESDPTRHGGETAGAAAEPLPAIALLKGSPLFFFASREPIPEPLADLLQARRRAVALRSAGPSPGAADLRPGRGYAVVITSSAGGSGLFPSPRGLVAIGMASEPAAAAALRLLFPPGARSTVAGGSRAMATRESFPLAGEFDLWGAAVGTRVVFATDTSLIDAVAADPGTAATDDPGTAEPAWRVTTIAAISMEKAVPLLRRWAAPLSGLIAARWPEAPPLERDLELLSAVSTVRIAAGADERRDRAAITLQLRDLR